MFMNDYNLWMLFIVISSYLLGSIPTAYIAARINKVNIFEIGSGNMGATNVSRALGIRWGIGVMLFDMLKGMVAILIAIQVTPSSVAAGMTVSAISVIIGHNWSLFASLLTGTLKGGKGAATAFGTLVMIAPWQVIAITAVIGLIIVLLTRYVSLGVLTTFFFALIWTLVLILQEQMDATFMIYTVAVGVMLMLRFRENIYRLRTGTERRLGDRAQT